MREDLLKGLTEGQIAKLKECKGQEEILAAAKEEGIELTEDQLEAVSGGCGPCPFTRCPRCQSDQVIILVWDKRENGEYLGEWQNKKCNSCGYRWDYEPA